MIEQDVQNLIRLEASTHGVHLFRNNSGAAVDRTGRAIRFGLGNDSIQLNKQLKSSDLIGITPYIIRPQDVGRLIGVFTAIEVKRSGWTWHGTDTERAQAAFTNLVQTSGGISGFASSVTDYLAIRAGLIQ